MIGPGGIGLCQFKIFLEIQRKQTKHDFKVKTSDLKARTTENSIVLQVVEQRINSEV